MDNLRELKGKYYDSLDKKAKILAEKLTNNKSISLELLKIINELYMAADYEKKFDKEGEFESAYQNPITSEFEFFISRLILHYSKSKQKVWQIHLRKQSKGKDGKLHVPDIRIGKNGKTIAIIEIKAKAGWIQPFFSSVRVSKDLEKLKSGKSNFNPLKKIEEIKNTLKSYSSNYDIPYNKVFLLLPNLALVARKKENRKVDDYKNDFSKNSDLPKENLILLSNNLFTHLGSHKIKDEDYQPTKEFETFLYNLTRKN